MNTTQNTTATHGNSHIGLTIYNTTIKKVLNWISDKQLEMQGLELRHKSDQTEAYKVLGTPYQIIKEKNVWFTVIGKIRTSEDFYTKKEAIKDAKRLDIDKVMELIEIMHTARQEYNRKPTKK